MPRKYFVDTWFLIALIDRADAHHARVVRLDRALRNATLITHDAVLAELLTFYSGEGSHARELASREVREALNRYVVLTASRELFLRSVGRYERRPDKAYSLVDCMSMEVMEQRDIQHVLTNDHHFRQEGFTVVNE